MRWSSIAVTLSTSVLLSLSPSPAAGQFAQYTSPGGPDGRPQSLQERLEGAMEEARWRLGPIRLEPWLGVRDVGGVDDVSGEEAGQEGGGGDLTATAGAGLRAYLPTGPKVVWAAHLLPEYVWIRDASERSDVNGRYGAGFFGSFNRLEVQATVTRRQELGIVSSEVLERVRSRSDEASLAAELRLAGSIYLFAAGSESRTDNLARPGAGRADFDLLDRTERVARAGLRLRSRRGWAIGAGAEWSEVDFEQQGADRSNSGTSPLLVIDRLTDRLSLGLELAFRSLEPEAGSGFLPYDGVTGGLQVVLGADDGRLQPAFYASRNLVYSLSALSSYFEADRVGASLALRLGWRTGVKAFAEVGRNDHASVQPQLERRDEVTAYGASLDFGLYRSLGLTLGFSREEVRSQLPGADQSFTIVRAGLSFGGGLSPWY